MYLRCRLTGKASAKITGFNPLKTLNNSASVLRFLWSIETDPSFFSTTIWLVHGQLLGHYRGGSLTHPMLITCVLHARPESHREPRNEVGSLNPAEHLVGFEPRTFRFWSQRLNLLGHSPHAFTSKLLFVKAI